MYASEICKKNSEKYRNELQESQDELEQYSKKLHIRISGVEMAKNETSNDVLQNVTSIIEESSSEIPDFAIERVHQFSKVYTDKNILGEV